MAQQERYVDESEIINTFNELERIRTSQLYTRLKVRYAGGIGISLAVVMKIATLQLDMALTISIVMFIIAIPLFAYLIFSLDEAEGLTIEWIWATTVEPESEIDQLQKLLDKKIDHKDYFFFIKNKLQETKQRAHKRVVKDIVVGLIGYLAVFVGFAAFLWYVGWYFSALFAVLSTLVSYRFVRTLKRAR